MTSHTPENIDHKLPEDAKELLVADTRKQGILAALKFFGVVLADRGNKVSWSFLELENSETIGIIGMVGSKEAVKKFLNNYRESAK